MKPPKILNLIQVEKSEISYKKIKFSDSQELMYISGLSDISEVLIISKMSWGDLQAIVTSVSILYENGISNISLYCPYILGARSDRKFSNESCNYMKSVIAPILNNLRLKNIYILDPHSDVTEGVLDNIKIIPQTILINRWAEMYQIENPIFLSPDSGASKRTFNFAKNWPGNSNKNMVCADKHRDIGTGHILGISLPAYDFTDKNIIIPDDICDGGWTFEILSDEILKKFKPASLNLFLSHGIFSKGIDSLLSKYNRIFTTNSFKELTTQDNFFVVDVYSAEFINTVINE